MRRDNGRGQVEKGRYSSQERKGGTGQEVSIPLGSGKLIDSFTESKRIIQGLTYEPLHVTLRVTRRGEAILTYG